MELGFEFRRDLEQLVHDGILRSHRKNQRSRFRPGVSVSSHPIDVQLQQRTKKKLARAFRSLCDDYGVPLAQCHEALAYTNSLEDALRFLALQYTSEELPPTLRALPKSQEDTKEHDGELVAEVHSVVPGTEKDPAKDQRVFQNTLEVPQKTPDKTHAALAWTHDYVLNMVTREDALASQEVDETLEAQELRELETRYAELVATRLQLNARKKLPKTKKRDKVASRQVEDEIHKLRRQLLARGWQEPSDQVPPSKTNHQHAQTGINEQETSGQTGPVDPDPKVSSRDLEATKDVQEKVTTDATIEDAEDDQVLSLFDQAEASVVSAEEIAKSAAIDPSVSIATQAIANLAQFKKAKGGKVKKGRNGVKLAANVAAETHASAPTWTGKSPRDQLDLYCRKQGFHPPRYKKLDRCVNGKHAYALELAKKSGSVEEVTVRSALDAVQGFPTIADAKDAVATRALFELASHLPLYRVLPPAYREMWQTWSKEEHEAEAAVASADRAAQDELLTDLVKALPVEIAEKRGSVETLPATKPVESMLLDWSVNDWDADLSDDATRIQDTRAATALVDEESRQDEMAIEDQGADELSIQQRHVLLKRLHSRAYRAHLSQRAALPIAAYKEQIIAVLEEHDVVLIAGETGCGKSTQVPQYLLEHALLSTQDGGRNQLICTQPRRLAALSLAARVSTELGEANMGTDDSLVGYHIRLDSRVTRATRLVFCTTGILLRKLQDARTLTDQVSHVIVDEVHERDVQTDVLLAMLRQFLRHHRPRKARVKVILMSATLNAARFQHYFGGPAQCPILHVPGRTFPVEQFFLEDVLERTHFVVDDEALAAGIEDESEESNQSTQVTISGRGGTSYTQQVSWPSTASALVSRSKETHSSVVGPYSDSTRRALERINPSIVNYALIQVLLEHLTTETTALALSTEQASASVLIFLPGLHEITTLLDLLRESRVLRQDPHGRAFAFLPLHSSLSAHDQQRIFHQTPNGIRIIAATNIAETSLTIEDVKVVIDTGRVKQMRHDAVHRTNVLEEIWIARANAKQRTGRAGRTSGGLCFRLFPTSVFETVMRAQPIPEMQRAPLTSLCLQIKTFHSFDRAPDAGCRAFLQACLDPPDATSIQDALDELIDIGALAREHEELTALGRALAHLPVDVKVGKLLVLGALFDVFDAASTCAAILETKSPFVAPFGRPHELHQRRQTFAVGASDFLTDVNAFEAWRHVVAGASKKARGPATTFCHDQCLNPRGLFEITQLKRQFRSLVAHLGFLPLVDTTEANQRMTREDVATVSALLYASLAPNLVRAEGPAFKNRPVFRERDQGLVVMHPSSINYKLHHFPASRFFTYAVKLQTSQLYLPASSLVLPLAVCLFSSTLELVPHARRQDKDGRDTIGVRLNDWLVLQSSFRSAVLIEAVRLVVRDWLATNLQSPPFLNQGTKGGKEQETKGVTDRETVMDVVRALFLAEVEACDPLQHLSRPMGKIAGCNT